MDFSFITEALKKVEYIEGLLYPLSNKLIAFQFV